MSVVFCRKLSLTSFINKGTSVKLKGKSKSSQEWLLRQMRDPFVEKAKLENYRCRSAFKLIEMNDKFRIFQAGSCVIDCGAAPGSWTQVAVDKTNADAKDKNKPIGFVIGLDRLPIYPIPGAILLDGQDFKLDKSRENIIKALGDRKPDIVMSDMAPNATGVKSMDHDAIVNLVYTFLKFAITISPSGASLLFKLWEGGSNKKIENDLSRFYDVVRWVKPNASRNDSSEIFLYAKGLKTL